MNIMSFPERWAGCRIVKLEKNYRSTPQILEVANSSIKGNLNQFDKILLPTRTARGKPRLYYLRDGDQQAMGVISMIRKYQEDGYKLRDMVILYRAHFHSIELQMMLGRNGIPFSITSGISVFEQIHIKDVLALLQLLVNKSDYIAFDRIVSLLDGVGKKTAEKLWQKIGCSCDFSNSGQRRQLLDALRPAAKKQWQKIDTMLEELYTEGRAHDAAAVLEKFCSCFYEEHLKKNFDNVEKRLEDIEELSAQISGARTLEDFLQEVALLTNVDHQFERDAKQSEDRIHLSTIHQAKGLEWPVVFIIWLCEDMFPSARSLGENENDHEKRRLFYVAVTRAQNELDFFVPRQRRLRDGGCLPCKASRFVTEVPSELMRVHTGFHYY